MSELIMAYSGFSKEQILELSLAAQEYVINNPCCHLWDGNNCQKHYDNQSDADAHKKDIRFQSAIASLITILKSNIYIFNCWCISSKNRVLGGFHKHNNSENENSAILYLESKGNGLLYKDNNNEVRYQEVSDGHFVIFKSDLEHKSGENIFEGQRTCLVIDYSEVSNVHKNN